MNKQEISVQINEVFIDILNDESITLNKTTKPQDIEEWDSLMHVQLVVGLEKKFKIRFMAKEIRNWSNVGEIIDCIYSKF